jgi:hypothetical protein
MSFVVSFEIDPRKFHAKPQSQSSAFGFATYCREIPVAVELRVSFALQKELAARVSSFRVST